MSERSYGRGPDELRPVTIEPGFVATATGSVLMSAGETRVICTASHTDGVPKWLAGSGRGWVTAEYGMLPASTGDRKQRDVTRGRPDGRTVEIQRLIGRSLRGVIDFARWARTRSTSTATCSPPTGAPAARRSPAPTWRSALACDALRERGVLDALAADRLGRRRVGRDRRRRAAARPRLQARTRAPRSTPTSS